MTWLTHVKLSKVRKQLKVIRGHHIDLFKTKQAELRRRWSTISSGRRVIVHIPSLGLAQRIRRKLNNLPVRENYQIGRLCDLEDPNVDVIYVSPMRINDEILQYYKKFVCFTQQVICSYESSSFVDEFTINGDKGRGK